MNDKARIANTIARNPSKGPLVNIVLMVSLQPLSYQGISIFGQPWAIFSFKTAHVLAYTLRVLQQKIAQPCLKAENPHCLNTSMKVNG